MSNRNELSSALRKIRSVELKPGDIIIFKRNEHNRLSKALAWGLHLMEHDWDCWGWHMGYIRNILPDGAVVTVESLRERGVQAITYPEAASLGEVRIYRWLDELDTDELEAFSEEHIGLPYDMGCYFWTIAQRAFSRFAARIIKRPENDKYTCWELVCAVARAMQKPLEPVDRYPLITDLERTLEGARIY